MSIRKFIVVAAACAALTSAFAETSIEDQGIGAIGWTPVQVGLFAPVSFPWDNDWDVKGLELNLFYAEAVRLQGFSLVGGAVRSRDLFKGVALTGLCNWHERNAYGVDLALIGANLAFEDVYGLSFGWFSMRRAMYGIDTTIIGSHQTDFTGLQASLVCNLTLNDFTGVDMAVGLNMTKKMTGVQLGGINFAHELNGLQLGLFNVAEECPGGLQLGFVNIIMDNTVKILPITNFYF